jgi:uncharacterized surface anchored protein/type II secretory pathway pseudopilin PulG
MTLVELMIASSVLLVCLTSLAGLLGGSVTSSRLARIRDEAANLANEKIEYARSLDYDRVGVRYPNGLYGSPEGDILTPVTEGSFTVTTECTWVRTAAGRAAYKKLVVHVAWQQPVPGQVDVTTMIYGKSNIVISGDLVVRLRYRENSDPVLNATVAVIGADGRSRSVLSDATGEAFFGQVAIGPAQVSIIPPAGCVVDTSTVSNVVIAADAVTTIIGFIQHPAQATIHVAEPSGTPVSGATVTLRRGDGAVFPAVQTNGSGEVVFTGLLYSDYSVTIAKEGYPGATAPVAVGLADPAPVVPVTMSPAVGVGITVRVTDSNGTVIPGAVVAVCLDGNSNPLRTGVSGANGEISFTGLVAGTYHTTVSMSGYSAQTLSNYLHDGDQDTLDFHMQPVIVQGNLRITTRDHHDAILGHTRVVVDGPDPYYSQDLYTDHYGTLLLQNLVPGSYQVGCYTKSAGMVTVIVNGGQTAEATAYQTN